MKIVTVVGARPQFIKAATVSRAIAEQGDCVEVMIHTGQHFDANMSDVFFQELEIPKPAYSLGVGGGTHGQNTGRMIEAIEAVLLKERPDAVLVYGDTDSTLAGALAAAKLHVPIVHVEAGLRSFNRAMPEEINRKLTDHLSDLLLTPNQQGIQNLALEGITGSQVINVGDVMFDAALYFGERAEKTSKILQTLSLEPKEYWLATVHRQENTDDPQRLRPRRRDVPRPHRRDRRQARAVRQPAPSLHPGPARLGADRRPQGEAFRTADRRRRAESDQSAARLRLPQALPVCHRALQHRRASPAPSR